MGAYTVFPHRVQVIVAENHGFLQSAFPAIHDVGKGAMHPVIFPRLHLNGQHLSSYFYQEVYFSLPFVVMIIRCKVVRNEFLRHQKRWDSHGKHKFSQKKGIINRLFCKCR